jgi:serine/threonine-protein phosphatase 4 regulatory subunit 1
LLDDPSRWVRMSAYKTLGPFISTFAYPSITRLSYNQNGELVILGPDGFEFRSDSNYTIVLVIIFGISFRTNDSEGLVLR